MGYKKDNRKKLRKESKNEKLHESFGGDYTSDNKKYLMPYERMMELL